MTKDIQDSLGELEDELKLLGQRYRTQQLLGRNAGRRTLLAQDMQTGELVVIKLLTFDSLLGWDDLKLFEREAETLKALSHPAIPRYVDFIELDLPDSKSLALVQTYVEGRSLEDYLKSGRTFTEAEIKQLVQALLDILTYLHGRNPPVIHRDIKPSNILLHNRSAHSIGDVYLVDFGSVQTLATQEGRTVTVVGTYGYMPPEQFGGRALPASDLYGVGATAIALATGRHPAELPQQELRLQFESAVDLSSSLINWLKQATDPNLERRFNSAEIALHILKNPKQQLDHAGQLAPRKILSIPELLGKFLVQGSGFGMLTGTVCGGLFASAIFPGLGTVAGAVFGGIAGSILGGLNSLLLAGLTRFYFSPLHNLRRHRQVMQLVSAGVVFIPLMVLILTRTCSGLSCNVHILSGPMFRSIAVAIALIAGLNAGLTGREIAKWYEQETRNEN